MKNFIQKSAILILILGLSSCSVYHNDLADVQTAIDSNNRVRVETTENVVLELKELRREDGQLIGITRENSETAKLMAHRSLTQEGKFVKIPLRDEEISAIKLRNRKMSNVVSIGVPLIGVAGLVGITNPDFRPDVGY
ncbi:hypothetical protein [Salinimicrobium xinjiangense]|uniref:hypothetical protein n=1 Tax=Salinimicrobium xinjiangense TaxID=438596 RepID=UPI0004258171|nr:hypothetical protein [Salinimicrobium xinjiangense]